MNHLTKRKIILYLAIIFVAGGVTGAVISWAEAKQKWSGLPSPKTICDHFRNRLQTELGLSPQQARQLEPLLRKRVKNMEAIHLRTIKEIDELIRASNEEIAAALQLTQEQRIKLAAMEQKRREYFGRRERFDWRDKDRPTPP